MDFKYPYTDFHELNLDWFLAEFKKYYEKTIQQDEKIQSLDETVTQFTNFVNNYFDNLDVQQEINNKLDVMAADGTLASLLQPYFNDLVSDVNEALGDQNNKINVLESRMDTFASLEEGSTTGDAELMDIRVGFNGVTYSDAGTAVRSCDSIINNKADGNGMYPYSVFETVKGFLGSTGNWINISNSYQHIVIPVKAGQILEIANYSNDDMYIGVLASYTTPVLNAAIPYSSNASFNSRKNIKATLTCFVLPSDAKYVVIQKINNNNTITPDVLKVDNYDYLATGLDNYIKTTNKDIVISDDIINGLQFGKNLSWTCGTYSGTAGNAPSFVVNKVRRSIPSSVKFTFPVVIRSTGTYKTQVIILTDLGLVVSIISYTTDDIEIPANTAFLLTVANNANPNTDISEITDDVINSSVKIGYYELSKRLNPSLKWIAMGDSITYGWYSYWDGDTADSNIDQVNTWAHKVSVINNWAYNNVAVGGMGYLYGTTPSYVTAAGIDFSDYDVVTLAYGVNDWKGNQIIGSLTDSIESPASVIAAMRKTIETILASNPTIKIIVITPLNCVGYGYNYGDESTNWGLGYEFSNSGTLQTFFEALVSVCNYYGIEYVDMTHYSVVNRKNLLTCLPDGVHPSLDTHATLAHELASKISVK